MRQICSYCHSTAIELDPAQGNSVCTACGAVLEENTIVSEVTFVENAAGTAVLQGQFVSDKGVAPPSMFGFQRRFPQSNSLDVTLANARAKIQNLARAMQLSEHHAESAHRWFALSLQHNFTRGRRSQNISAACLYIVCRQEKTSHMLLDFSDVLRTNVYELGAMFVRLSRLLGLELPLIDPSLYIGRFTNRLEFGEKAPLVANTALRLVSRMKRDWIQTGRRPAGICGACILISARLYGFSRTQQQVIDVMRICYLTLRRRLDEFAETQSSQLTPDEFHNIWLEQEADPPAFTKNRAAEAQQRPEEATSEAILSLNAKPLMVSDSQSLDDVEDDHEIMDAILGEQEIEVKTKIWVEANREYMEQQEERKLAKEREGQDSGAAVIKRKRKEKPQEDLQPILPTPASEAASQVPKRTSRKFNYDVFDSLVDNNAVLSVARNIQKAMDTL